MEIKKILDEAGKAVDEGMERANKAIHRASKALDEAFGAEGAQLKNDIGVAFSEIASRMKFYIDEETTDNATVLKVSFPGIPKERIQVTETGPFLTVKVFSEKQAAGAHEDAYLTDFVQTWNTGASSYRGGGPTTAVYADGLLTITIPKTPGPKYETKEITF